MHIYRWTIESDGKLKYLVMASGHNVEEAINKIFETKQEFTRQELIDSDADILALVNFVYVDYLWD